jgi:hypothetical protein
MTHRPSDRDDPPFVMCCILIAALFIVLVVSSAYLGYMLAMLDGI